MTQGVSELPCHPLCYVLNFVARMKTAWAIFRLCFLLWGGQLMMIWLISEQQNYFSFWSEDDAVNTEGLLTLAILCETYLKFPPYRIQNLSDLVFDCSVPCTQSAFKIGVVLVCSKELLCVPSCKC